MSWTFLEHVMLLSQKGTDLKSFNRKSTEIRSFIHAGTIAVGGSSDAQIVTTAKTSRLLHLLRTLPGGEFNLGAKRPSEVSLKQGIAG
jgi:hypothetical protein